MDIEDVTGNLMDYKTSRSELPEDLYQPLYDTVNIVKGDVRVDFFGTPHGHRDPVSGKIKTKIQTNIDNGNVCPTKIYTILDMFLKVKPRNEEVLSWMVQHGVFNLKIIDKSILDIPLIEWHRWHEKYEDRLQYGYKMPAITIQPYENFFVVVMFDEPWPYENIGVYFSFSTVMRRPT